MVLILTFFDLCAIIEVLFGSEARSLNNVKNF